MGVIMIALGTLSSLGFGPLHFISILGMDFLDFFDFLTNSVMMPIAALSICFLVTRVIGIEKISAEIEHSSKFKRKKIYILMMKYIAPIFIIVILISSILNVLGIISM